MSYWYQYATTSNRLNRSYVNGFLDISGGDLTLRNSNFNVNGLIAQNTSNIPQTGSATVNYSYISWNDVSNNFLSSTSNGTLTGSLNITNDVSANARLFTGGDVSANARLFVGGDVSANSRMFLGGDASLNKRLYVGIDASINGNASIGGNLTLPSSGTHTISGNITITGNTSCGNSTVTGNETVTGTETVGNLTVTNSLVYTPSSTVIAAATTLSQPLASVYFINSASVFIITLPNPTISGQTIHFRRTAGTTTNAITFATSTANFVVPINSITGSTATLASGQYSTKFICNGTHWFQVYAQ